MKITTDGQPCRKCSVPVRLVTVSKPPNKTGVYWYSRYLQCPGCRTQYFLDDAKVYYDESKRPKAVVKNPEIAAVEITRPIPANLYNGVSPPFDCDCELCKPS